MSESLDERPRVPLSVETDLTIEIDGVRAEVESAGQRLLVQFRSLADAVETFRGQPDMHWVHLAALLTVADLTAEIRVRDRMVAVVGADARPQTTSELLRFDPIEIRIEGALGAVGAESVAKLDTWLRSLR